MKTYLDRENAVVTSVYEDTERIFGEFTRQAVEKIDEVKKSLINDINAFYLRGEGRVKVGYLATLKQLYEEAYDKNEIAEVVSKYL